MPYNYAAIAAAPLPAIAPYKSGKFYSGWNGSSGNSGAQSRRVLRVAPIIIPVDLTIDQLGLRITTVSDDAAAVVKPCLYTSDDAGMPGSLHAVGPDIPVGTGQSTAGPTVVASSIVVPKGVYWLGGMVEMLATATQPQIVHLGGAQAPYSIPFDSMDGATVSSRSSAFMANGGAPLATAAPPANFFDPTPISQAILIGYRVAF